MGQRHPNANATQRERRKRLDRVDYYPSPTARATLEAVRDPRAQLGTNSQILDFIVSDWARLVGVQDPELMDNYARTRMSLHQEATEARTFSSKPMRALRVVCGAKRRSDGKPCEALSVPGRLRCKWHGGFSTGPRTVEGKARVAANLPTRCPLRETQ